MSLICQCSRLKHVFSLLLMSAGAPLLQLLVLKPDIRVRAFSVSDDISREKLRELLLHIRSSAMTHLVLMTSHHLAKLVLDQVTVLNTDIVNVLINIRLLVVD